MFTTFLYNIETFNNLVNDIYLNYKKIYKLNKNDKCYLHITPLIVNNKTFEEIYDVIYISAHENTISKIACGNNINISVKTINENDKFYTFNIISKSFILLNGYDILRIKKYIDYDKSKSLINDILNKTVKSSRFIIGSGDLALHIENYIINNVLTNATDFRIIANNILCYIDKLYNEFSKNLTGFEIFFDLVVDANNYNLIINDFSVVLQILIVSYKTDNNQDKLETFKNILLQKYNEQIININYKNLQRSVFVDIKHGIRILVKFTSYLELLFFIAILDMLPNV